jgi:hypothetical protein
MAYYPFTPPKKWPQRAALASTALLIAGCATTYRPMPGGEGALAFVLTPGQCLALKKERRGYEATGKAALIGVGAGAVVGGIALAFTDDKKAPAIGSAFTLGAGIAKGFTDSQVSSLDDELTAGGCSR